MMLVSKRLYTYEWLAISFIILTFVTLTLFAIFKNPESLPPKPFKVTSETVELVLKGAVENPGIYQVPIDLTLNELLLIAKLKPEADLTRFQQAKMRTRKLKMGEVIEIPKKKFITVYLKKSEHDLIEISVEKGATLKDLLEKEGIPYSRKLKKAKLKEGQMIDCSHF